MKVLVACEFSGIVREAFGRKGHQVWSCDLLPSEKACRETTHHYQGDVMDIINDGWDMMIAHPPCTYLSIANARWYNIEKLGAEYVEKRKIERIKAIEFFKQLLIAPIKKICIENPKPMLVLIDSVGKSSQVIQPYMFGHQESKTTNLWLKGLSLLKPTNVVERGEMTKCLGKRTNPKWMHSLPNNKDRWKIRSRTFKGIANAMAEQWG